MLPLIDVVFLLLVFFIYAMLSMVLHRGLAIRLPEAAAAIADQRDFVAVTITKNNLLFVNREAASLDTVAAAVTAVLEVGGGDMPVYIQGDRDASLGIAVSVLDRLRAAGITQVSFSCSETIE